MYLKACFRILEDTVNALCWTMCTWIQTPWYVDCMNPSTCSKRCFSSILWRNKHIETLTWAPEVIKLSTLWVYNAAVGAGTARQYMSYDVRFPLKQYFRCRVCAVRKEVRKLFDFSWQVSDLMEVSVWLSFKAKKSSKKTRQQISLV